MSATPNEVQCIKCEKRLRNFAVEWGGTGHQPNEGLAFHTHGAYGTTYFDPMDGSYLELTICDECVKAADERGLVHHGPPDGLTLEQRLRRFIALSEHPE